jgi:hypothetical protein
VRVAEDTVMMLCFSGRNSSCEMYKLNITAHDKEWLNIVKLFYKSTSKLFSVTSSGQKLLGNNLISRVLNLFLFIRIYVQILKIRQERYLNAC